MTAPEIEKRAAYEALAGMAGSLAGDAWFLMLGLGIIHHHVQAVPAFGYWLCVLLWLLLGRSSASNPIINTLQYKIKKK